MSDDDKYTNDTAPCQPQQRTKNDAPKPVCILQKASIFNNTIQTSQIKLWVFINLQAVTVVLGCNSMVLLHNSLPIAFSNFFRSVYASMCHRIFEYWWTNYDFRTMSSWGLAIQNTVHTHSAQQHWQQTVKMTAGAGVCRVTWIKLRIPGIWPSRDPT